MGGAGWSVLRCNPSQNATQKFRARFAPVEAGDTGVLRRFGLGFREWLYLPLLRGTPEGLMGREPSG